MKSKVFVVFKTYKNREDSLHDVFIDEKSAIRSVKGIKVRHKTHAFITGAYYKKFEEVHESDF